MQPIPPMPTRSHGAPTRRSAVAALVFISIVLSACGESPVHVSPVRLGVYDQRVLGNVNYTLELQEHRAVVRGYAVFRSKTHKIHDVGHWLRRGTGSRSRWMRFHRASTWPESFLRVLRCGTQRSTNSPNRSPFRPFHPGSRMRRTLR